MPSATAVGQEAEVAHAHEALGQNLEQEAPNQFLTGQRQPAPIHGPKLWCGPPPSPARECPAESRESGRAPDGIMQRLGTHTLRHTPFVSPGLAKAAQKP